MKFWNRLAVLGMTLVLALSLSAGNANAASKKSKKKKEVKKEAKREAKREARREAASEGPIAGGNLAGQPGYFYAPTAEALNKGQIMGAGHLTFDTAGNVFQIPVGLSFGITDKLLLNVNTSFYSVSGASGLYNIDFGGKYTFTTQTRGLDIAAGVDFAIGPLTNYGYGTSSFGFDPYGVVTYTFRDGLQLNGKLGLYVTSYNVPTVVPTTTPPYFANGTASISYSYFQFDLGVAYPFDRELTGIAELATNGVIGGITGGTPLIVGIRTGHDVQLQAFGGLDLNYTAGLLLGGGVVFLSK